MGRRSESGAQAPPAGSAGTRTRIVPWSVRATELLAAARRFAWERRGDWLRTRLGNRVPLPGEKIDADLERSLDDLLVAPGSMGDGRSILRAFAEEADGIDVPERAQLLRWERERRRGVYLLDRCLRDRLEAWDPVAGRRIVVHFAEAVLPGRAAALTRGTVVTAIVVPWNDGRLAQGAVEIYEEAEAIRLFRNEVRGAGHVWHDPPAPAPVASSKS